MRTPRRLLALFIAALCFPVLVGVLFGPSVVAGIIQAVIPAAVPAANKQGNSAKFQLAGTNSGTLANLLCNDANGNTTDSGCGGAASTTPFSGITSGNNTNALVEATGGTLTSSGTGVIESNKIRNYTVGTLPSATAGMIAYVTDGTSATDCTVGGASTKVLCQANGAAWAAVAGVGGGSPGGSNNQLQYRVNSTTFGGVGSFVLPNVGTTGAPVASLPLTGWSVVNSAVLNDFSQGVTQVHIVDNGSVNFRGITRTITVPYTIYAVMLCQPTTTYTSSQTCGFAISDGTKYETFEYLYQNSLDIQLETRTTASVTSGGSIVTGPTVNISTELLAVKMTNNSTNRVFSYWSNGAWVQFQTEASGTFLTETQFGILGLSATGSQAAAVDTSLFYLSIQ